MAQTNENSEASYRYPVAKSVIEASALNGGTSV